MLRKNQVQAWECNMSEEVKKSKKDLLLEKKQQIELQLKAITAREVAANRKMDTRRKVILGAMLLKESERDADSAKMLASLIAKMDEKDRLLFA